MPKKRRHTRVCVQRVTAAFMDESGCSLFFAEPFALWLCQAAVLLGGQARRGQPRLAKLCPSRQRTTISAKKGIRCPPDNPLSHARRAPK